MEHSYSLLIMSTKEERHTCKQKTVTSRHCVNCEGQRKLGRERDRGREKERKRGGIRIWQKTLSIKKIKVGICPVEVDHNDIPP